MLKRSSKIQRKGFSLVEIMVVVAVIAILAASVGNIMGGSSEKAKFTRAERDLESLYQAFINVYNVNSGFGANLAQGDIPSSGTVADNIQKFLNRNVADVKDPWNNAYRIKGSWNDTTKVGSFSIHCQSASAADTPRKNTFNGDSDMMRYIINNN